MQEFLQSRGESCPRYVCEDTGTQQKHIYVAAVTVSGRSFEGVAEVKQQAEQAAARSAMEFLKGLQ